MEDFFRENYWLLTKAVILIATITALIYRKKFKGTVVTNFIYFLIYVVFVEVIAGYTTFLVYLNKYHLLDGMLIKKNYWWYALAWTTGSALFFSYYYRKIIKTKILKTVLKSLFWIMVLTVILVGIVDYKHIFSPFPVVLEIVSFIVVVISALIYFIDVLLSNTILKFYKSIHFYMSCAILFWWLVTTPLAFYQIYFSHVDWNYIILKWQILLFANILMYLTFAIALIWCKPQNN